MRLSLNVRRPKDDGNLLDVVYHTHQSSAVNRLEYRAAEKQLLVYWTSGKKFSTIENVSARQFQRVVNSKSTGRAIHRLINR